MRALDRNAVVRGCLGCLLLAGCSSGGGGNGNAAGGNHAPSAEAGSDQSVTTGNVVGLSGVGSDPDGDILEYHWAYMVIPAGSQATLSNPWSGTPSFVADVQGSYEIRLVVEDGAASAEDRVTVSVTGGTGNPGNTPPTADAGADVAVAVGDLVGLAGAAADPDAQDLLTYEWTFISLPPGSQAS